MKRQYLRGVFLRNIWQVSSLIPVKKTKLWGKNHLCPAFSFVRACESHYPIQNIHYCRGLKWWQPQLSPWAQHRLIWSPESNEALGLRRSSSAHSWENLQDALILQMRDTLGGPRRWTAFARSHSLKELRAEPMPTDNWLPPFYRVMKCILAIAYTTRLQVRAKLNVQHTKKMIAVWVIFPKNYLV